ncbi:MAG: hypothetical protein KIS92_07910 [Planctomycetota bacterium]|nr:hypothetical protein [Planctomycetota bacterium]
MSIAFVLIWIGFLAVFAGSFYREVKRTPWDLLEMLLLFVCVGHAVALPVSWGWKAYEVNKHDEALIYLYGSAGLLVGLFMAGGAVWAFRRLNRLNEKRRSRRLYYLLCGVLLFPSMIGFAPVAYYFGFSGVSLELLAGVAVWSSLARLHTVTMHLPDPGGPDLSDPHEARLADIRKRLTERYRQSM